MIAEIIQSLLSEVLKRTASAVDVKIVIILNLRLGLYLFDRILYDISDCMNLQLLAHSVHSI